MRRSLVLVCLLSIAASSTTALELVENGGKLALATMCIGVGQGIACAVERV